MDKRRRGFTAKTGCKGVWHLIQDAKGIKRVMTPIGWIQNRLALPI